MKRILALLACIMTVFGMKLSAQETRYGIYIGGSANNITVGKDFYYDDSEVVTKTSIHNGDTVYSASYRAINGAKVTPNAGLVIGGFMEYEINYLFGLQVHLLYNRYGYDLDGSINKQNMTDSDFTEYKYSSSLKMSNISAAFLFKINVFRKNMSVELGVQPSYCVKMTKDVEIGPLHKSLNYDSKNDYSAFNVCGSAGLTWYFLEDIFVSLRLNYGLINVLKTREPYIDTENQVKFLYSDSKSTTNAVYITAGYKF